MLHTLSGVLVCLFVKHLLVFVFVLRMKTAVLTDERVRLMNEILSGMRVIKMYCWETMFGKQVQDVRR